MDPIAFLGRLHPMVVHFPVALLVTAVLALAWQRLRGEPLGRAVALLVQLAALSTVPAVALGLMWADAQGFRGAEAALIDLHKALTLSGSLTAIVAAVLFRLWPQGRNDVIKVVMLCAATSLIGVGAHFGGTSVHGELREASEGDADASDPSAAETPEAAPAPVEVPDAAEPQAEEKKPDEPKPDEKKPEEKKEPARTVDFKKDVWPIFDKSCIRCHGTKKKKGDLRLDKKKYAMKGGEDGKVIIPGNAEKSPLYKLTTLGEDDEDVMPAKGDLLTKEQQDILKRWINEGAHWPE